MLIIPTPVTATPKLPKAEISLTSPVASLVKTFGFSNVYTSAGVSVGRSLKRILFTQLSDADFYIALVEMGAAGWRFSKSMVV